MQEIQNFFYNFIVNFINFDYIGFISNLFTKLTFESFLKILLVYFFIVWIAIIIWVTKDIINRSNNVFLQSFSILTVLFGTPLGIVVYLLIRPSKTLFEQYYDENLIDDEDSDIKNKELQIEDIIQKIKCPSCNYEISEEYKYCPNCRICLKKECISCKKILEPNWTICPYCGKDQEEKITNILNNESTEIIEQKENLEIITENL